MCERSGMARSVWELRSWRWAADLWCWTLECLWWFCVSIWPDGSPADTKTTAENKLWIFKLHFAHQMWLFWAVFKQCAHKRVRINRDNNDTTSAVLLLPLQFNPGSTWHLGFPTPKWGHIYSPEEMAKNVHNRTLVFMPANTERKSQGLFIEARENPSPSLLHYWPKKG